MMNSVNLHLMAHTFHELMWIREERKKKEDKSYAVYSRDFLRVDLIYGHNDLVHVNYQICNQV